MSGDSFAYPTLPWSDSFKVGIEALDADHRALVRLINEVCACWAQGDGGEARRRLDALVTLAREHFQREEVVLRRLSSYDKLPDHVSEHRTRTKQLIDLVQQFHEADDVSRQRQLCVNLVDWFVRQSIGHDAAIKGYFDDGGGRLAGGGRQRPTR
jgi:hemerythrin